MSTLPTNPQLAPKKLYILIVSDNYKALCNFATELESYTHFPCKYNYSNTKLISEHLNMLEKYDLIIYLNMSPNIIKDKNIVIWNPNFISYVKIEKSIINYPYSHQVTNFDDLSLLAGKIYLNSKPIEKQNKQKHLKVLIPVPYYSFSDNELKNMSTPIISISTSGSTGRNSISPCMMDESKS